MYEYMYECIQLYITCDFQCVLLLRAGRARCGSGQLATLASISLSGVHIFRAERLRGLAKGSNYKVTFVQIFGSSGGLLFSAMLAVRSMSCFELAMHVLC